MGGGITLLAFLVFTKLQPIYIFIWVIGAIAYCRIPEKWNGWILLSSFAFVLLFTVLLQSCRESTQQNAFFGLTVGLKYEVLEILYAASWAVAITQLVRWKPKFRITGFIERTSTWLAAFSYTLYLTHIPVLRLLQYYGFDVRAKEVDCNSVIIWIAMMAVALFAAYVIYLGFERNTGIIKKRLKSKI